MYNYNTFEGQKSQFFIITYSLMNIMGLSVTRMEGDYGFNYHEAFLAHCLL